MQTTILLANKTKIQKKYPKLDKYTKYYFVIIYLSSVVLKRASTKIVRMLRVVPVSYTHLRAHETG